MSDPVALRVLVCDDDPASAADWGDAVQRVTRDGIDVCVPDRDGIRESLSTLSAKQSAARSDSQQDIVHRRYSTMSTSRSLIMISLDCLSRSTRLVMNSRILRGAMRGVGSSSL